MDLFVSRSNSACIDSSVTLTGNVYVRTEAREENGLLNPGLLKLRIVYHDVSSELFQCDYFSNPPMRRCTFAVKLTQMLRVG